MNARRLFQLLSLGVVITLLAACGGAATTAAPAATQAQTAATTAPAQTQMKIKMGLLSPGSVNDSGWNSIAYNALKQIESQLGAETAYIEITDAAGYEKAMRDFANRGFNVILAHGNEYEDAAKIVAKDYPNVHFLISSSRLATSNITGLNTDTSQIFYLMGVIAAKMGKKGGLVGGIQIPPVVEAFQGFVNGAKSVNPNYEASIVYTNSFSDAGLAKEAAVTMINGGADFVIPDADQAGLGVYQAIADTNGAVKTFGIFGVFNDKAPKSVLANFESDYGVGIVRIVKAIQDGSFQGGQNVNFGLKDNDVMKFTFNDSLKSQIPADVITAVNDATAKIEAGQINTLAPTK
jgi:basic membrane protein A